MFYIWPKKNICVWVKRGSVDRLFFSWSLTSACTCTSLMYFEKGVDANISCVRFGAGDL